MMALPHDMVGVCMSAAPPQVLPTFGAEPRLGTNPIAVAVPAKDEPPFVLDIATSVVAVNKFRIAKRLGAILPGGMVADMEGTPIMEPGPVPDEFLSLPAGSLRELGSHKGYGLACVVEILSTVIGGFGFAARNTPRHRAASRTTSRRTTSTRSATWASSNRPWTTSCARSSRRSRRRATTGCSRRGRSRRRTQRSGTTSGIPLHKEVVEWFHTTCAELDIPCGF